MVSGMEDVVYDLVREFLRHGPPASRNQAFEAYSDPRFSRAARIYQFLASVRQDLQALSQAEQSVSVDVQDEGERVALVLTYGTAKIKRTAYLGRPEWRLVWEEPQFRALLSDLGIDPPPEHSPF